MNRLILVTLFVPAACDRSPRFLDEFVFHPTPVLTLKVARYYESLPFHFTGEIYVVLCGSANSRELPAGELNAAGWRVIGRGAALGSTSAELVADKVRHEFSFPAPSVVVWSHVPIFISLDGCRTEVSWNPVTLPQDMIDPAAKPEYCGSPAGPQCAMLDFQGDRLPEYSDVRVTSDGQISFMVRSPAIKGVDALRVSSSNAGRTWQVEPDSAPSASGQPCRTGDGHGHCGVQANLD